MSDTTSHAARWGWRVNTAAHLTGVLDFALLSNFERNVIWPYPAIIQLMTFWGLSTLVLCPLALAGLIFTGNIARRQAPTSILVACAIEATQFLAMIPLVQ